MVGRGSVMAGRVMVGRGSVMVGRGLVMVGQSREWLTEGWLARVMAGWMIEG